MAPISATKLNDKSPGLQLIAMSFDGFLYIVDGYNGCVETSDVGEVAYAMVRACMYTCLVCMCVYAYQKKKKKKKKKKKSAAIHSYQ